MPDDPNAARSWLDAQEKTDRKNARIIDRVIMALPRELGPVDWQRLVKGFADDLTKDQAAWLSAIHAAGSDAANPHAHLIIRDRHPETGKRVAKLSDKGAVERVRRLWEQCCNRALEAAGRAERIDRRSHAARGLRTPPQRHRGPVRPSRAAGSVVVDHQPGHATGQSGRLGAVSDEGHQLVPFVAGDHHVVLGQRLARGDVLELPPKVTQPPGQAGAGKQGFHAKGEDRIVGLVGHGLAGEAVEPALDAARQLEVVRVNGEDVALPENRVVEPWRQLDLPRLGRVGVAVGCIRGHHRLAVALGNPIAGQPIESGLAPLVGLIFKANVGDNQGGAQPPDCLPEFAVVSAARSPPHLAQRVMRREANARGWLAATFYRIVQMRGGKNDQIPVPDCRNREPRVSGDADLDVLGLVLNRLRAAFLQGQERVVHHVPIVAQRRIERGHREHVELDDLSHVRRLSAAPIPR